MLQPVTFSKADTISSTVTPWPVPKLTAKAPGLSDNLSKALLTTVREAVDNALDACEEAHILPEIRVTIEELNDKVSDIFGDKNSGITEFIAKKFSLIGREAMLIYNNKLSVSPMTTHVSLKNVSKNITKNKIVRKIESINNFYKNKLKFYPKIGVIGLNPHNDELRRNSEEKKIIIPAIKFLKKKKVRVEGPISGDTAFLNYKKKGYNVLVGMYHDQVLAPFKALFGFNAINITVGIPILRISPDHGTGKDIKNKNKADPTSLIEAVKFFTNKNVKT